MNEYPSTADADHNLPVFTVGEMAITLKRHIEQTFQRVRVRGEISGYKRAASGHVYFALKDAEAVLDGVCWRGTAQRLSVALDDGLEVIATGRLTTYPSRSRYQIVVEAIELAGEGALLKLLEDRRKALAAEGLFDAERKRPIPYLPDVIGVVTSPTGAVIRDILHRLSDRFPRRVLLWPVLVQGQGAAEQIASAIDGFNALSADDPVPKPDVLIVARGGGSLEDLWSFNEEIVIRAAAASRIPLISAVGHETDWTLIDLAADERAPTPTAAAERAVPVRAELVAAVFGLAGRLVGSANRMIVERRTRLTAAERGLPQPVRLLEHARQRLDDWSERLRNSLLIGLDVQRRRLTQAAGQLLSPRSRIERDRERLANEARVLDRAMKELMRERVRRLDHLGALLESASFTRVLDRGFALVLDRAGTALTSVSDLKPGRPVRLRLRDGETGATIDGPGGLSSTSSRQKQHSRQASLFDDTP
ncbi:MAG: exodeoxyribonuclease VII large subunit [Hyphomicrobiales bacterium]|nr:exodeoxyribonuclease VII large subunit [Hyphomicrobiales bacterium]